MTVRRDAEARRSGYPFDLREDGPAGPVVTKWDPGAFEWYGGDVDEYVPPNAAFVRIMKCGVVRISGKAVRTAGIESNDTLLIGVNKAFLAIRKGWPGYPVWRERKGTGVYINSTVLKKRLVEQGWPEGIRLPLVYDPDSGMLVARKPKTEGGEAGAERGGECGHAGGSCRAGAAAGAGTGDDAE